MDARIALANSTQLRFQNKEGGAVLYTIVKELSRGGSCIVYDASYETNSGDLKHVRVKECYPSKLRINRSSSGALQPFPDDILAFNETQKKFQSDFSLGNGLFYANGLFDALTNTIDIYSGNGTTYLVSAYSPESTLATYRPTDLKACITLIRQVSQILKRIHNEGYIYLDIKPENVLVSDSYTTRVQLFDFDSLIPMSLTKGNAFKDFANLRLSYSKGFAAIELQTAKLRKLGPHTDVYGVGALLFFLLFGKTPTASDCEATAAYDYSNLSYASDHQDRLFFALTEFFHNALANYYLDRYHDMQQVIDALSAIEKLSDSASPYIRSTPIVGPALMVGRQQELQSLQAWYESDEAALFVTGMGGIGKSTLVRAFLSQTREELDSLLYLNYTGSIPETLADDHVASISTVSRDIKETFADYYARKLSAYRSIISGTKAILVIDNYTGEITKELLDVLTIGWKVILITRQDHISGDFPQLAVSPIQDSSELYSLFEHNLGRSLSDQEKPFVDNIILEVAGHTLVLDLISKQIASSYLTIEEASTLVTEHGFSNIAPEKVVLHKDLQTTSATIRSIITAIFAADNLSPQMQSILKVMTLLSDSGIDIHTFHKELNIPTKDDVNVLINTGWLQISGRDLSMHPVMLETVHTWDWTEVAINYATLFMSYLFRELKLEGRKEDYPQRLLSTIEQSAERFQKYPKLEKWFNQFTSKKGVLGETLRQRYEQSSDRTTTDRDKLRQLVQLSESVCNACKREPELQKKNIYLDLLYCTILNMPRFKEVFILDRSLELIQSSAARNGIALMKLYHCVIEVYQEQNEYDKAHQIVLDAETTAKRFGSNYVLALYYDLITDYYDSILNGAYQAADENEAQLLTNLTVALDKGIQHARRSRNPERGHLLAKMLLAKATIMMRSNPNRKRAIDRLIDEAKAIVIEDAQPYAEIRCIYYMVCAWYFTIVEPSLEATLSFMEKAKAISDKTAPTDLDEIDNMTIPCADMLCNWEEYSLATNLLLEAIQICEKNPSVVPYMRKKLDLYGYLLDVCFEWNKLDLCKELISEIQKHNERYKPYGIQKEISPELIDLIHTGSPN